MGFVHYSATLEPSKQDLAEAWLPSRPWAPDGPLEKVGEYRNVRGMRIDPTAVGEAKVFRPWGWNVALIVSEEIKHALERIGNLGVHFDRVTGPQTPR